MSHKSQYPIHLSNDDDTSHFTDTIHQDTSRNKANQNNKMKNEDTVLIFHTQKNRVFVFTVFTLYMGLRFFYLSQLKQYLMNTQKEDGKKERERERERERENSTFIFSISSPLPHSFFSLSY